MNELRQTALSQVEIVASKSRFGLFSQPPPLAIGDDSLFKTKQARRGQDGKTLSQPRNMLAGPNRSGIDRKAFIDPPESIHAGDKYLDPQKLDALYNKKFHTRSTIHELEFKPGSGYGSRNKFPYHHIDENPIPKKKPARDETGRVVTSARNVQTNHMHRIHSELFKDPKHISDPINRKQLFESRERKQSKKKMPNEMPRNMSHGDILFSNNKVTFGFDDQAQAIMKTSRSPFIMSAPRKFRHQSDFKLARRGHGDPIGKYPEFIMPETSQNKPELAKSVRKQKSEKQQWKPNGNRPISRPTPSISYSSFNLRKMM